ncbi:MULTISPECIES: hypothetical protein [unclassified Dietzia]|uniref:hypothetical protein n=1 Tax=unclassified Dietzia TaxID=2617939 RepID=UPI000D20955D|nr:MULTISPECIES: hypothetical protein [unclassified Dietzia]AVZ39423.1 hypothetical protein CT688_07990 [Dietzia sp. JS16-p6b]QGW24691.1 hypothetical protein GJR88_02544 [Dietzia sp. DQ12-45-1b]
MAAPRRRRPDVARTVAGRVADALGWLTGTAARAADRRLDSLGLAPPPLDLPPEVRGDLCAFFGHTIDPAAVMIRRGHVPGVAHPRAFALPGLIYLGVDAGVVRPRAGVDDHPRATPTLVHELVHVWQGRVIGPRYVVIALAEQALKGRRAYDWRAALDRGPHDCATRDRAGVNRAPWMFPVEAHAQLVSDAYALRHGFTPPPADAGGHREPPAVEEVLAGVRAGRAPTLRARAV